MADYPFTTLEPLLGVTTYRVKRDLVSHGKATPGPEGRAAWPGPRVPGLSLERCHLLLHVIDATGYYGADPEDNFRTILSELDAHTPALGRTPQVVVLNKVDAIDAATREQRVCASNTCLGSVCRGHPAYFWMSQGGDSRLEAERQTNGRHMGKWLAALVRYVAFLVAARRESELPGWPAPEGALPSLPRAGCPRRPGCGHMVYRPTGLAQEGFSEVRREDDHFAVEGGRRTDGETVRLCSFQAVRYLGRKLDRMGVHGALRRAFGGQT